MSEIFRVSNFFFRIFNPVKQFDNSGILCLNFLDHLEICLTDKRTWVVISVIFVINEVNCALFLIDPGRNGFFLHHCGQLRLQSVHG